MVQKRKHKRMINVVGEIYGRLTVTKEVESHRTPCGSIKRRFLCNCVCGKEVIVQMGELRSGKSRSCGCLKNDLLVERSTRDLTGRKLGRWRVVKVHDYVVYASTGQRHKRYVCQCDCGAVKIVRASNLASGISLSCGCWKVERTKETRTTHGHSNRVDSGRTRTYGIWLGIKTRCLNPNHHSYKNYGARGIEICARWSESYENFLEDMGEAPVGMSIDRYPDNNGNYEPGNCRWATDKQQANNTRRNVFIYDHGKRITLRSLADETGLSYYRVQKMYRNQGMSVDEIRRLSRDI